MPIYQSMTFENQSGEEITKRTLYEKAANPDYTVTATETTKTGRILRVVIETGAGREVWERVDP